MKKSIAILTASLFLVGCTESAKESNNVSYVGSDSGIHEEIDAVTSFESFEDFFCSDICVKMKDEGFEPCELDFNSDKYELLGIESDSHFYDVTFKEKNSGEVIVCTVTYDYQHELETSVTEENTSTISAEKNGFEYEIIIEEPENSLDGGYALNYTPFSGYKLAINSVDNAAEMNDILSYFNEFTLVPDEGDA